MSFLCLCKYCSHLSIKRNYPRFWQELSQIWVNLVTVPYSIPGYRSSVTVLLSNLQCTIKYAGALSFSPKKLKVPCLKHIHSVGSTSPAYISFWLWDNENIHSCKTEKCPRIRKTDSQPFQKSKIKEQSQPYTELIKACLCNFFMSRVLYFKRT